MKSWQKQILIGTVSSLLLAPHVFQAPISAEASTGTGELNEQKKESEKRIQSFESELEKVKADIAETKKRINDIEAEMETLDSEIAAMSRAIDMTNQVISETEEEIALSEIELEKKKEALSLSLRTMYSRGETSYFDYLFATNNVSDIIGRLNDLKRITEAHNKLHQDVKDHIEDLNMKKESLIQQRIKQEEQKKAVEAMKDEQESMKKKHESLAGELAAKEAFLIDEIEEEEKALAAINHEISEAIRKLEEKKAEAKSTGNKVAAAVATGTGEIRLPMNPGTYWISSNFGWRTHPVYGTQRLHNGTDFAAPEGTPIYAVDSGTVLFSGPASGYGNWIVIDHGNMYSIYGHMYSSGLYVRQGETVQKGQHIAGVGSAGTSTGNHLHFSIAKSFNGQFTNYVDPMSLF